MRPQVARVVVVSVYSVYGSACVHETYGIYNTFASTVKIRKIDVMVINRGPKRLDLKFMRLVVSSIVGQRNRSDYNVSVGQLAI